MQASNTAFNSVSIKNESEIKPSGKTASDGDVREAEGEAGNGSLPPYPQPKRSIDVKDGVLIGKFTCGSGSGVWCGRTGDGGFNGAPNGKKEGDRFNGCGKKHPMRSLL